MALDLIDLLEFALEFIRARIKNFVRKKKRGCLPVHVFPPPPHGISFPRNPEF